MKSYRETEKCVGQKQRDKGTQGTETVDSGWTKIMPGRGDVTMDATVGASFGKADARMGYLGK